MLIIMLYKVKYNAIVALVNKRYVLIAQYPVHRTAQSALHFTPWQTCSFQGHLNFFGKYSATLQLLREGYSFTYPPLSVLPGTHLYS